MLNLFLELGKGMRRLSLKLLNRLRRPFRKTPEQVFEVTLKHLPFSVEGKRYGQPEVEVLEVSARSARGATTRALKLNGSRLSLSGPFLKKGEPEVISVFTKAEAERRREAAKKK